VCRTGWTPAAQAGKIPSRAQANIRRDTLNSMPGRSLISATAAPAVMAARPRGERKGARSPEAVGVWSGGVAATNSHGTAWYTAAVKLK
jgi:hypothetical protein